MAGKNLKVNYFMFSLIYGAYEHYTRKPEISILILGIDNVGKTTTLEQSKGIFRNSAGMSLDKIPPTIGLNVGRMNVKGMKTIFWDVGGHAGMRTIWNKYYEDAHGMIFVVDSSDMERLIESREVFKTVLLHPATINVPVLLFANKQDLENALPIDVILDTLELTIPESRKFMAQPCSALTCEGLEEGISWLVTVAARSDRALAHTTHF